MKAFFDKLTFVDASYQDVGCRSHACRELEAEIALNLALMGWCFSAGYCIANVDNMASRRVQTPSYQSIRRHKMTNTSQGLNLCFAASYQRVKQQNARPMRHSSPHMLNERVCTLCSDFQPLIAVSKRLGKQVHHVLGLDRPLSFRGTSHDKSASATSAAVDQYQVEHTTMFVKRLGLRTLSYSLATLTPDLLQLGEDGLRCSALSLNFSIWRSRGTTTCMQLPACDDGHCMQQRCTE
jgi:hypothetical protein